MSVTGVKVEALVDEGLGNSAYLVDLGDGRALAVDASRDLRSVREMAARRGLKIAYAADTHLHADFLSGAVQLSATDDAVVLASAAGGRAFPHRGLHDGDEVDLGGLRLQAWATPGHTDEHLAFLLLDGAAPIGVFTGGSLIVGAAARTDLVAPERTEDLARAQYHSLHRLMGLPDEVAVWPTHGAGSFCSAPPGAERTSTVGRERATNPLLATTDEGEFVARLLGSLGSFPTYFHRLGEANRRGPTVLPEPLALAQLGVEQVRRLLADGAMLVDVRPIADYAAAHVPGSLSNELRAAFATWLGWLVPDGTSVVVLRNSDQDPTEIAGQAAKVGYDVAGELAGGLVAWVDEGLPTSATGLTTADALRADEHVLDIRQDSEFAAGHLPGAEHHELGGLAATAPKMAPGLVTVMCGHGERAMTAASVLERAGRHKVRVLLGGPADWAASHGVDLESGP
ncbi:MBL fold metallo-hydrolase [Nocardioides pocheonensis]|uniref:MBL fold metallo-hydrolase n=1 Tax=Nocardioides pocheonensis TaxID=661485 RepID=A0A3N0GI10_9ACTN|nr:rhodanese-like domain-containing protein [Nocardioides pocheonensis]RNM12077.1 MBL fold metallo-hydrolase [Nocardioides pocheonensis]